MRNSILILLVTFLGACSNRDNDKPSTFWKDQTADLFEEFKKDTTHESFSQLDRQQAVKLFDKFCKSIDSLSEPLKIKSYIEERALKYTFLNSQPIKSLSNYLIESPTSANTTRDELKYNILASMIDQCYYPFKFADMYPMVITENCNITKDTITFVYFLTPNGPTPMVKGIYSKTTTDKSDYYVDPKKDSKVKLSTNFSRDTAVFAKSGTYYRNAFFEIDLPLGRKSYRPARCTVIKK